MNKIHIKPKEGKQVPDPYKGGYVPAKGFNVDENDVYWQRRIADGDFDVGPAKDDDQLDVDDVQTPVQVSDKKK